MNQHTPGKPLLLVLLHHDYAARDFIDSGVLSHLGRRYELWFVTTEELGMDVTALGRVAGVHSMTWLRTRLWEMAFGLTHLDGLDPIVKTQPNRYDMFQRGTPRLIKRLVFMLHRVGVGTIMIALLRRLLLMTAPSFIRTPRRAAVALLPSGIKDPAWDDTIAYCRRNRIPSLTVTINWDNIAHKLFLHVPDRIGVWGEQGYLFARLLQRIPAEKIVTIGTPRFEVYRDCSISKDDARRKLGLPEHARIVLFAGSGVAFDEVSLVEEFERAMAAKALPADLFMVYKPHPKRHRRAAEPPLRRECYRYVRVVGGEGLTSLADYPILLGAVDGLMTPMSTMLLEGALMGLPALGLAYDDPAHGDYSWANARDNNHLHPIINSAWHVLCTNREHVLAGITRLIGLMGNPDISLAARRTVSFLLHQDTRPYAVRVEEVLDKLADEELQ